MASLTQVFIVQQCTIHIISYLKGKILTMKPPGHPGTVSNRDSILEAAQFSDRL